MSDQSAWNHWRVRHSFRRGFIAGVIACGGVAWVCYLLGLSAAALTVATAAFALICMGLERVQARIAVKDYERAAKREISE